MISRRQVQMAALLLLGSILAVGCTKAPAGVAGPPDQTLYRDMDMQVRPVAEPARVQAGDTFTVFLVQQATDTTRGVQADLVFDPQAFEVLAVTPAKPYTGGGVIVSSNSRLGNDGMSEANRTGRLNVAVFLPPTHAPVPAGEQQAIAVEARARKGVGATAFLRLRSLVGLDAEGKTVRQVAARRGEVVIGSGALFLASFLADVQDTWESLLPNS